MSRLMKHLSFIFFLIIFAGCAGSCSGCDGCGMTPLPGGFPTEDRIQNAASARVTQAGLSFISSNISNLAPALLGDVAQGNAGVITFEIPTSKSDIKDPLFGATIGSINVCPNGPKPGANPPECVAEVDLGKAKLTIATAAPHNITVKGTLALRLQKLQAKGSGVASLFNLDVVMTNGGKCSPKDYADIPVDVDISIESDTDPNHGNRLGYSKVKILKIGIDNNKIEDSIAFCGSGFDDTFANLIKGLIIGSLVGGLTDTVKETVEEQLCTSQDTAAGITCPTGSYPDGDDVCRYCTPDGNGKCANSNDECVGIALGVDGNINLSQALSSLSPGTKGGFDFLAAAGGEGLRDDGSGMLWGDLNPINAGASLGMMGGAEPTPITQCVPIANLQKPTDIPIPDELTSNTVAGWTGDGPHLGFALSERYLNYALGATYNSGALCLGVGSSVFGSLLNSDTIGLLLPSFKELARQQQASPLALVLRPQQPPVATVGNGTDIETDPLLKIDLKQLGIDFYVWSNDRFIRAFTANFDVVVPVNLDVTDQGLAPVIDKVLVENPTLSNAELLREDEQEAAKTLADIISGQIGGALGGAIDPINLNDSLASLGLTLTIPPTVQGQGSPGLRLLQKDTDRFLGLFASFGIAPAPNAYVQGPERADTTLELGDKLVDPAGLSLPTITADNRPRVDLRMNSNLDNGANRIEYQYRLDGGYWRPWTFERNVVLSDPTLSVQGRHLVEVRARIEGVPASVDTTPASVELLIDKTAPIVEVQKKVRGGRVELFVRDTVSPADAVQVRYALDDGEFGKWQPSHQVDALQVTDATRVRVEARDEEGNVATVSQSVIRGKEDASLAGDSGCNCRAAGPDTGGRLAWLLPALLGLGLVWRRRRPRERVAPARRHTGRRTVALFGSMLLASSFAGCSCGTDSDEDGNKNKDNECPNLDTCELLEPGLVGAYSSATVASDGTVWVAGYEDVGYGTFTDSASSAYPWGDLVVGKLDGGNVEWEVIDGLPEIDDTLEPGQIGGPPDPTFNDVDGFRKGLTDPGDDVGLWTSIAMVGGKPAVAYYDATHRALKYARYDGKRWSAHTVQTKTDSDVGRYAKLVELDGKPAIAFLFIEPGADGSAQSGVRIAKGSATASSEGDWSFEDAVLDPASPCRFFTCGSDLCNADTGKCVAKGSGCDPKCAADEGCIDEGGTPACIAVHGKNALDTYPEGVGLYISLAKTAGGLGLVYYDRVHGNLMAARQEGGSWQAPVLIDGQAAGPDGPVDTGDVGIGASLFVDSQGDWHVAYANGFDESVMYARVTGGTTPSTPEVVDDGATPDGQAIVGDDCSIWVDGGGEVMIAYQDATNGELRWAVGAPNGAAHDWTKKTLPVDGFVGGFNQILDVQGSTQVLTWWRIGKPRAEGNVSLVTP